MFSLRPRNIQMPTVKKVITFLISCRPVYMALQYATVSYEVLHDAVLCYRL